MFYILYKYLKKIKQNKISHCEVMGKLIQSQKNTSDSNDSTTFLSILITSFSTIFYELGDKTQLATLMLSAQSEVGH